MFRLALCCIVGAVVCAPAFSDSRFGNQACIVEDAHVFDPTSGKSMSWANPQRSFLITIEACSSYIWKFASASVAEKQAPTLPEGCQGRLTGTSLTTSLKGLEDAWSNELIQVDSDEDFEFTEGLEGDAAVAELEAWAAQIQSVSATYVSNRSFDHYYPTLRIDPDLSFYLLRAGLHENADGLLYYSAKGKCTPFE